ncbi:unnamed protein product [Cyprideis torosa]|uniref:Uncharacterized protein n=1 Tax=Cyprideis torosa TaxID=163714 RepID=A0A7R8ZP19_9CRUS|nr:unnamed protein product [Cyprideis torosa]CAG0888843.1 unnamed protein product [Cyprideis torosa]
MFSARFGHFQLSVTVYWILDLEVGDTQWDIVPAPTKSAVEIPAAETRFGQYPWQGIVLEKPSGILQKVLNFVCGATLIHPKVVMTAAHCVEKYQHVPRSLIVRMGEYDTRSTNEPLPFQDRQVSYIKVDPHFNPGTLVNDVALLFMRRPFYPAANVNTICLPTSKNQFHAGKRCIATGFGKDAFGPRGKFQSLLKQVELPLVPNRACQHSLRSTRLGRFFNLDQSFLCAGGERGVDACTGDGGGPLVCKDDYFDKYYQVGITSWGIGCGQSGVPGVYADVANALDFINSNVGLHGRDGLDEHPEQSDEGDYDDTQDGKQESSDLSEDGRRLQELFEQAQALQVQNSTGDPSTDSLDNQKENKDEDDGPNGSIGSLARSKHKSGNSDKNEQPQDQLTISFG